MRKLLILISLVIVLCVAGLFALPYLLSMDGYKPAISELIEQKTGQKVVIDGTISLRVFPSLSLEATQVHLKDGTQANAPDLASVGTLSLQVELWPLLHKQIKVQSLHLLKPVIDVTIDQRGKLNWDVSRSTDGTSNEGEQPTAQPAPPAAAGNKVSGGLPPFLQLDNVLIQNGSIAYQDKRNNQAFHVTDFTGTASLKDSKGDISFKGTLDELKNGAGKFSLSSTVTLASGTVQLDNLKFTLGSIEGSGQFKRDASKNIPLIEGGLYLGNVDLTPYRAYLTSSDTKTGKTNTKVAANDNIAPAHAEPHQWDNSPINVTPLREMDGHFGLYFDSFHYQNIDLGKGDLYVNLKYGKLSFKIKQLQALDGNIDGELTLTAHPSGSLDVESVLNAKDVKLDALPNTTRDSLYDPEGTVTFTASLKSRGNSQAELISALQGNAKLGLKDASLERMDKLLESQVSDPLLGANVATYVKAFGNITSLDSNWQIENGIASNNDLRIQAQPLSFIGKGTINLPDYLINYRLTPIRTGDGEQVNVAGIRVPDLTVSGALSAPKTQLDVSASVNDLIQKGLDKDKVKDIKKDLIEKRRKILDNLQKNLGGNVQNLLKGL